MLVLALGIGADGCSLFRESKKELTPAQVTELVTKFGDLQKADKEDLRAQIEQMFGVMISDVKVAVTDAAKPPTVTAVVAPAVTEIATKAGATILDSVEKNPSTAGLTGGLLAAFYLALGILGKRKNLGV
jgi:ribosomal protein L23